jgi:hypothetical protein
MKCGRMTLKMNSYDIGGGGHDVLEVDLNIAICLGAKENHENLDYVAGFQADLGPHRDRSRRANTYTASFGKSA